ncbi:Vgb family protein [Aeromicrobium terrae]|uniref:SMP-30/gluconolactonase/LRE family protein n=1 Tax=Aeromicrobium terrae TaxID=2498846 RepID=A0A5C8NFX4_9ACTN|nr:PQQ-binding-like beta-propeller repeat protein [Aeromicrobium terrae]TXL57448.1 hypothetical protein FHP06_13805 [Aeromicrobium terrae]
MVAKLSSLVVSLVLATTACSSGSDEPKAASSPEPVPSPTSTYSKLPSHVQPASWVATDLEEADVFAGKDSILVGSDTSVVSVDPERERLRWRRDVPAYDAVDAFGSVWVSDGEGGVVHRLDRATGKITAKVTIEDYPIGLAATTDEVWVAEHHGGTVARIDPKTEKVAGRVKVGTPGNGGPMRVLAHDDRLYVDMFDDNRIAEVDPTSATVVRTFAMPKPFVACGPMRVVDDALWVTGCLEVERVARIDLASGKVTVSDDLGGWAGGFLARGRTLWLSGKHTPPDFTRSGGFFVAVDPAGRKVASVPTDTTGYSSVEAFGSWWLTTKGGVARYDPADLEEHS